MENSGTGQGREHKGRKEQRKITLGMKVNEKPMVIGGGRVLGAEESRTRQRHGSSAG